jgi:hypothetical protein
MRIRRSTQLGTPNETSANLPSTPGRRESSARIRSSVQPLPSVTVRDFEVVAGLLASAPHQTREAPRVNRVPARQ